MTDTATFRDVQYWLALSLRSLKIVYNLVITRNLTPSSPTSVPLTSTFPISSLFPDVDSSLLECKVLEFASALRQIFIGCKGIILVLPIGSDGLPIQNAQRAIRVGSGLYSLLYYHNASTNLYAATDNGLCFVHDTSRANLNIFKVTVIPTLSEDYAVSVFVDSVVPTVTSAFWGTRRGQFFRTDWPGLTRAVSGRLALPDDGKVQLTVRNIIPHPQDDMTLLLVIGETPNYDILTPAPAMDGTNSGIYSTTKDNCAQWNDDCESCGKSPYCGWCYSYGKCYPKSQCTGTDPNRWTQTPTCPSTTNAVPMRGDKYGGTNVTISGSFVTNQQFSLYKCQWVVTASEFAQKKDVIESKDAKASNGLVVAKRDESASQVTFPPIAAVDAIFVSENMVTCKFPGTVGKAIPLAAGQFATATVRVLLNAVLWGSELPGFKIFDCGAYTDCQTCNSQPVFPECGWCYKTGNCTLKSSCDVSGFASSSSSSGSGSNTWSSEASTCPATSQWTQPASISARASATGSSTSARTLKLGLSNVLVAPSGSAYQCAFSSLSDESFNRSTPNAYPTTAATVTVANDTTHLSSLTCVLPAALSASEDGGTYKVHLRLGNYFVARASSNVVYYDCPSITRCDMCTNTTYGDCGWTTSGTCKYKSEITSGQAATTCPKLTSTTPSATDISTSKALDLALVGSNLNAQGSNLKCLFQSATDATSFFFTTAASLSATGVTCTTPTDADFDVGLWQVSLAPSSATTATPMMQPLSFEVYDCSTQEACGTCLARSQCSWCSDALQTLGCAVSTSTNCSAPITATSSCPLITSVDPSPLLMNTNETITIVLAEAAPADAEDFLSCAVSLTSLETGGTLLQTSSLTISDDLKSADCNLLVLSGQPGNVSIGLFNSARSRYYTNPFAIRIDSCSFYQDCTSCLNTGCQWCASGCAAQCPITGNSNSLNNGPNCPSISSISPLAADSQANVRVTITGTNFMQPFTNPALPSSLTSSSPSSSASSSRFAQYELLAEGLIDWETTSLGMRRDLLATAGTFDDYYYRCRWGDIVTPARWGSATSITCDTPVIGTFTPQTTYPLTLMLGTSNYASAPSSVAVSFFQCPTIASDSCTAECPAAAPCGWCVSQSSCTSLEACMTSNNTDPTSFDYIEPIWQSQCVSAALNTTSSLFSGGSVLNVSLSASAPATLTISDLKCRFGSVESVVVDVARKETTQEISSVFCPIPPSPTGTSYSGSFDITYKNRLLTTPQRFSYVDCARFGSCGSCQSQNLCGWCRYGRDRCTVAAACPSDQWSRTQCPVNVLAVVLGVVLGLIFVIAVSALIIFLALRAYKRRKKGLVISLQEPDYDAIAWGRDRELQYKISPSKYSVLHAALCREDFLLQLAMSLNCPATEQESLSKGLVFVACAHDSAAAMICTLIRAEVSQCSAENQLFRSNSVASKMYKFYSRIVGIKYLFNCLARVIRELEVLGKKSVTRPADATQEVSLLNVTMELDLEKYDGSISSFGDIAETVDADTNLLQLQLICQKILNVLVKRSTNNIPRPLREIFVEIDRSVTQKYPGSTDAIYKGLGGLFFLRFVCPAITAPHVYGLLEAPPIETTQRQLVLIGKVVQSIANMSPPTPNKEGYMEPMANFIRSSIPRIVQFYDNLRRAANITNHTSVYERTIHVPEEVLLNGLAAAQTLLVSQAPKIKAWGALPSDQTGLTPQQVRELDEIVDACLQEESAAPKTQRGTTGSTPKKSRKTKSLGSSSKKYSK